MSLENIQFDNAEVKFGYAHNILSKMLAENKGVLKKNNLKELRKMLNKYVSFGPLGSKYVQTPNSSNFSVYDMNVTEYENKQVGDSKILFDEDLQHGYNVDLSDNDSNTLNKIISNPSTAPLLFFGNTSNVYKDLTAKNICMKLRDNDLPGHLTNAGKAPSKPKIIVCQDDKIVNSNKQTVKIMFVFYKNENNEMRVLFILQINRSAEPADVFAKTFDMYFLASDVSKHKSLLTTYSSDGRSDHTNNTLYNLYSKITNDVIGETAAFYSKIVGKDKTYYNIIGFSTIHDRLVCGTAVGNTIFQNGKYSYPKSVLETIDFEGNRVKFEKMPDDSGEPNKVNYRVSFAAWTE